MSAIRNVALNSLGPGLAAVRPDVDAAVARVLARGWYILGPECEAFEKAFGAYHGQGFEAIGVGCGTDALRIGLQALGVEPGDEVLVTTNAGVPPVAAVVAARAKPVFCDVDPASHTLDPAEIERRASPRTKAVLVVHLFGRVAAMEAILASAKARGLAVLEDCAQAHGARRAHRLAGTWGDAAAFSFYPTKNLGALGDGGAVLTRRPEVADRARLLRNYGWRQQYASELHSTNSRLDELQAAVLAAKLPHLDDWNAARRELAAIYRDRLGGLPGVILPDETGLAPREPSQPASGSELGRTGPSHQAAGRTEADTSQEEHQDVHHLYVVRVPEGRDELRAFLAERGVGSGIHYPVPAHLQPPYVEYGEGAGSLPNTERLASEVLSLPMYPELSPDDAAYVADQVKAFVSRGA